MPHAHELHRALPEEALAHARDLRSQARHLAARARGGGRVSAAPRGPVLGRAARHAPGCSRCACVVHLVTIIYAVRNGLSAAEILARTRGSLAWGTFYAVFVFAAAIHGAIGLRTIAAEWLRLARRCGGDRARRSSGVASHDRGPVGRGGGGGGAGMRRGRGHIALLGLPRPPRIGRRARAVPAGALLGSRVGAAGARPRWTRNCAGPSSRSSSPGEWVLVMLLAAHLAGGLRLLALELLPWRTGRRRSRRWPRRSRSVAGLAFALAR